MALAVYLFIGVITVAIYMDLLWTTFPALTDFLPKEQIEVADFLQKQVNTLVCSTNFGLTEFREPILMCKQ